MGDELDGRRAGLKDSSNTRPEARCLEEHHEAIDKGPHLTSGPVADHYVQEMAHDILVSMDNKG